MICGCCNGAKVWRDARAGVARVGGAATKGVGRRTELDRDKAHDARCHAEQCADALLYDPEVELREHPDRHLTTLLAARQQHLFKSGRGGELADAVNATFEQPVQLRHIPRENVMDANQTMMRNPIIVSWCAKLNQLYDAQLAAEAETGARAERQANGDDFLEWLERRASCARARLATILETRKASGLSDHWDRSAKCLLKQCAFCGISALPTKKLFACNGCVDEPDPALYCDAKCQKKAWPLHKAHCKRQNIPKKK